MMWHYTNEKHIQILLSLLKENGIKKVISSPGTTNMTLIASMQQDPYFEIYSSVDERSAAYMACGLAAESQEPVVLSCTGATASRNYLSGLTEAYYRKLPILVLVSTQSISKIGHLIPQVIDNSVIEKDVAKLSITIPFVGNDDDFWECEVKINRALLELRRDGGGPVHITCPTTYNSMFTTKKLPKCRVISRIKYGDVFPELSSKKIGVFIGSHLKWSKQQTETLDNFCETNNAVVFYDHTSNYKGSYGVLYSIVAGQKEFDYQINSSDILIHIGEVSGDYYSMINKGKEVWRVNEDGELRDTFRGLRYIFQMSEQNFFEHYIGDKKNINHSYLNKFTKQTDEIHKQIADLPFSNIWIASRISSRIPFGSVIHLGILNSLRSWNFFKLPESVASFSNVGGFGIDGNLSAIVGASLFDKNKLYFCVVGDLAFFYDMNVLGNRHIGNNIRILLINNGKGVEFKLFNNLGSQFKADTDKYIAGSGHFGNKSQKIVKHYAEDLGFEYLSAKNKEEFEEACNKFLTQNITDKSILLEVFTNDLDESNALKKILSIEKNIKVNTKNIFKYLLKK